MRSLLKRGDSGEDVKLLQKRLGLKADGKFGPKTEEAVKDFQGSHGLFIDGVVGEETQVALFKDDLEDLIDSQITVNQFDLLYMDPDEYVSGPNKPEYLFLHHTAGWDSPVKTITSWNNDRRGRVGTEFVIGGQSIRGRKDFDGVIVKCIPDGGWAYHLGKTGSFDMHKNSVGIELNNFGYLTKVGNVFKTYTGAIVDEDQVCDLGYEFNGHRYYHKYSDAQIESLRELILFIKERDGIDIKKGLIDWLSNEEPVKAFGFKKKAYDGKVKGMLSHTNVRKDKTDISPQPNLIAMLKSL